MREARNPNRADARKHSIVAPTRRFRNSENLSMNDSGQTCPTQQELKQLLTDDLSHAALDRVTMHVEACELCQQALERLVAKVPESLVSPQDLAKARAITVVGRLSGSMDGDEIQDILQSVKIPGVVLDSLIGRGGMGIVFAATQSTPVQRKVAVKLIRSDLVGSDFAQRFLRERLLLASIEHPNVARLYDAGQLPDGTPYFLMEFVDGINLAEHCRQRRSSLQDRLALFQNVCDAVQHLHRKQIIHRDLKPDNILVSDIAERSTAKLIDFGLAKLLDPEWVANADSTVSGSPVGTPRYMSPEQTGYRDASLELDTTTDVYSLGVILYELLTGDTPIDSDTANSVDVVELLTRIRELDPIRPSRRVLQPTDRSRDHALSLQTTPQQLSHELSSDLDWIVLKAIQKDPSERYATVEALARDIENYQHSLPVTARPPSRSYYAKKFYRRNRIFVWSTALLALVLCAGMAGTGYGLIQAKRAESEASAAADREADARRKADDLRIQERDARLVSEQRLENLRTASQMLQAVFEGFNPELATAGESDLREFLLQRLKSAASDIVTANIGESEDVLVLKVTLAKSLAALGEQESAIPLLEDVLSDIEKLGTISLEDELAVMSTLAMVCMKGGQITRAVEIAETAKRKADAAFEDGHPMRLAMLHYLASVTGFSGDTAAAIASREELIRVLSPDDPATANMYFDSLNSLAVLYHKTDQPARAVTAYRQCVTFWEKQLPQNHPIVLTLRSNLGLALADSGETQAGVAELREILKQNELRYPASSPNVGDVRVNLGVALAKSDETEEACELLEQTIASTTSTQTRLRAELELLATRLLLIKAPDVSTSDLEQLTNTITATLGEQHPTTQKAHSLLQKARSVELNDEEKK